MVQNLQTLQRCRTPRSHGNYLPALNMATEILKADAHSGSQLFVVFLSDGAPSDHTNGHYHFGSGKKRGLHSFVHDSCVQKISKLGDLFGRDRTFVGTVAFGPENENYELLQDMANELPRHSFQKLGLKVDCLRTAFSSLTSTLTSMNSEARQDSLTLRDLKKQDSAVPIPATIIRGSFWEVYTKNSGTLHSKTQYDILTRTWVTAPLLPTSVGVAHAREYIAKGAERFAYQCVELDSDSRQVGPRLVAKVGKSISPLLYV